MPKSAWGVTVVVITAVLLALLGSAVAAVTLAVAVCAPPLGPMLAVMVSVTAPPLATVPSAHVSVVPERLHPAGPTTFVLPAGNCRVKTVLEAAEGPWFDTTGV